VFVKLILPALLAANDPGFRPIKYALFPPLGLAALAGYLDPDDRIVLEDEHVMQVTTDDRPDLVVMSVYITSAYRAYQLADHYRRRGSQVALAALLEAAVADGTVRDDVSSEDLLHAITQLSQPVPGQGHEHNQRVVAVLLDGLRHQATRQPATPDSGTADSHLNAPPGRPSRRRPG
jgi:hypothetical protein